MRRAAATSRRWALVAATLILVLNGCAGGSSRRTVGRATTTSSAAGPTTTAPVAVTTIPPGTAAPPPAGLCGFLAPAQARYTHVMWIWMENHGYRSVVGSASAPFENEVEAQCGLATNYHNISHPSLPNYIAATSGLPLSRLGTFASDCDPSATCSVGPAVASIFSQAPSWKSYEESMPRPCAKGSSDDYAARHNPAVYYQSLAAVCAVNDVGIADLSSDLAGGSLPAFSFVTPNLIDDTHDGSVADGDRWLRSTLGKITSSVAYRSGALAVFVVWDEGEGGSASDCATNTTDAGCHVPALVVSASTRPGTSSGILFNHYSLLRTADDLLGLPALGRAADTTTMATAFGLTG